MLQPATILSVIDVIATINLKPGVRDQFLAIFNANVPNVLAEDGCHQYYPAVDIASGHSRAESSYDRVTVVEKWRDVAALAAHSASPHEPTASRSKAWSTALA
ncbi:MAG: putative quinol monooxygenase [Bryobacterales bacterium]